MSFSARYRKRHRSARRKSRRMFMSCGSALLLFAGIGAVQIFAGGPALLFAATGVVLALLVLYAVTIYRSARRAPVERPRPKTTQLDPEFALHFRETHHE